MGIFSKFMAHGHKSQHRKIIKKYPSQFQITSNIPIDSFS
jgi:hypothetical protein